MLKEKKPIILKKQFKEEKRRKISVHKVELNKEIQDIFSPKLDV